MRKRTTGIRKLKPAAPLDCGQPKLVHRARDGKSNGTKAEKRERAGKKASVRVQSKGRAGAKETNLNGMAEEIAMPTTGDVDELHLVTTEVVGEGIAATEKSQTINPIIPDADAELPRQSVNAAFGAEGNHGVVASDLEATYKPRILFAESSTDERQEQPIDAPQKQTEIVANEDLPESAEPQPRILWRLLVGALEWVRKHVRAGPARKRLRVCESVSLGEKRFVAVIEVDGEQFLVGGASSSVATLARLEPSQEFSEVLKRRWAQEPIQA